MKIRTLLITLLVLAFSLTDLKSQLSSIKGTVLDPTGTSAAFANVALLRPGTADLIKVETANEEGKFVMSNIQAGKYDLEITFVGLANIRQSVTLQGEDLNLGELRFQETTVQLEEAIVTGRRVMVEVKPDRTVFNVEGTINSVGSDAISLLRKAPGVTVDNNNNLS